MTNKIYALLILSLFFGAVALSGADTAEQIIKSKCRECHGLDRICKGLGKKDAAGWTQTIDIMKKNGALVSDAEKKTIASYLAGLKAGARPICE